MAKSLEAEALFRAFEFGLFVAPEAKVEGSHEEPRSVVRQVPTARRQSTRQRVKLR
jgi:hypothetical protein